MFVNPETKNRLNDMAEPSLFNVNNPPPKVGCKRRIIEKQDEAEEFKVNLHERIYLLAFGMQGKALGKLEHIVAETLFPVDILLCFSPWAN